ncbi:MAG: hypothetical protein UY50_C0027G0016 [Parcubacteria group bacterium GW2011_GWA2_49_9]|nr:MAG: hypothetical protein UY50_C0027G0016 [Parcubacteria group bacterium GW2011_GWA2_49_9]
MTLDTNIIIAYLKGEEEVASFVDATKKQGLLFLPATVEGEFLSFSEWTPEQRHGMEKFLEENFLFVPLDRPITRLAAQIRTKAKIAFADATIAATALFTNTPLLTRNVRDFKKIDSLQLISL